MSREFIQKNILFRNSDYSRNKAGFCRDNTGNMQTFFAVTNTCCIVTTSATDYDLPRAVYNYITDI